MLKKLLSISLVLCHPKFDKPFFLYTNATKKDTAIMLQQVDEGTKLK